MKHYWIGALLAVHLVFCASASVAKEALRVELDTYFVLDGRANLNGKVMISPKLAHSVQLSAKQAEIGNIAWQHELRLTDEGNRYSIAIPVADMAGGYYRLALESDAGHHREVAFVVRELAPQSPTAKTDYLSFVRHAVDLILEHSTARLGGDPDGVLFVTTPEPANRSYLSLGYKNPQGKYSTYFSAERPLEFDTFRADHEIWPILDRLYELTGDQRYAMVSPMLDAIAKDGFDPSSGLIYLNQECDFDVLHKSAHGRGASANHARFKPLNTGNFPQLYLDRMWQHMPRQMHRCFRAMFWGLITDPENFDYNRYCDYGFDDRAGRHALNKNSGYCAFDTAGSRMIHWWASCWRHTGDKQSLAWAQKMADKWQAVQHRKSGLIPNFFGAGAWIQGADQQPGQWCETRGAALTALALLQASAELRLRPGVEAEHLADQVADMGSRLAMGVAKYAYDPDRRVFIEHLHLDGSKYTETARYCFRTQQEKEAAVRKDPKLAPVAVYDGAGWYRNPNYYEQCAGSDIPYQLCAAATLCDSSAQTDLIKRIEQFANDAVEEANKLEGPFTPEDRLTFRATGQYVKMFVLLHAMTKKTQYLDQARNLADREMAALARLKYPQWWRMRERSTLLDALLMLYAAQGRQ